MHKLDRTEKKRNKCSDFETNDVHKGHSSLKKFKNQQTSNTRTWKQILQRKIITLRNSQAYS